MNPTDPRTTFLADPEILGWLRTRIARIVPDDAVENVAQQSVESAMRARKCPHERKGFGRWLCRIGRRRAIDFLRMRKTGGRSDEYLAGDDIDDLPGVVVADYEARDELARVQRALEEAAARPGLRRDAAWLMRRVEGHSYAEIATEARVPASTVEQAISRLRRRLRDTVAAALIALFLFLCLRSALRRPDEALPPPPAPAPAPTVAPVSNPAPVSDARDLREKALSECATHAYFACRADLDRARELDPDGESDARVTAARKAADRALRTHDIK